MKQSILFTTLIVCLSAAVPVRAAQELPESLIKYPVLVSLENGQNGTGFYVNNKNGDAFFVTSKHLLGKMNDASFSLKSDRALLLSYSLRNAEADLAIYIQLELKKLKEAGSLKTASSEDIAVIKIGEIREDESGKRVRLLDGVTKMASSASGAEGSIVGAFEEVTKKFEHVNVGNEVFIFGYPTSLGIDEYPQIEPLRPLLRKGVVAGKNKKNHTIIIDCPVQPGNSGGPVLEVERVSLTETRFSIIGMVSEYIPVEVKKGRIPYPFQIGEYDNSGYSVVIPMDPVLKLIGAFTEGSPKNQNE